jgi:hypothetical protein
MPAGRPSKFDETIAEQIVLGVRHGNFRETVAASVGIDAKTLRNWLKRGAKGGKANEPFSRFLRSLLQGEAEAKIRMFTKIGEAEDWKALQYRLAVLDPKVYGNLSRVMLEVEGHMRDLLKICERILPSALYTKLLEEITASLGGVSGAGEDSGEQAQANG